MNKLTLRKVLGKWHMFKVQNIPGSPVKRLMSLGAASEFWEHYKPMAKQIYRLDPDKGELNQITLGKHWIFNHPKNTRWAQYDVATEYSPELDKKGRCLKVINIYDENNRREIAVEVEVPTHWDIWVEQEKEQFYIQEWVYTALLERKK